MADPRTNSSHRYRLAVLQSVLLVGAVAVSVLTRGHDRWDIAPLIAIATLVVGSELLSMKATVAETSVSGSSLGIVVAAVLYGGGPAAAIGVLAVLVGWTRLREPGWVLRNNLVNFAWYPLLTALAFRGLVTLAGVGYSDIGRYALVFLAALIALVLNVVATAAGAHLQRGPRAVGRAVVEMVRPVLAAQLFSAVLTAFAAYITIRLGLVGLVMLGVLLGVCQYLLGELFTSRRRGDRLRVMATTDELTGLANRQRFRERIEERIADAAGLGSFAVLIMDLDRFKEINDTLGHAYGDQLLRELGPRLVAATGADGFVARLGGDEFGVLLASAAGDVRVVDAVVQRLLATVQEPFGVDDLSLEIGASIGVARHPEDGADADALMRCADVAMYAAKEAQTGVKTYAAGQDQHSMRRLSVLSDIRRALSSDEIVVHYQPIVDLEHRSVTGAEGLVRWAHPEHGLIPPGAFVQTVEQSGLIGPLTRHVLEHAIAECARWRADGRDMSIAVNLSVRNLLDRDLPREISRLLDAHHVPAGALHLEITESMIMTDPERAAGTVGRLSELGVRMSVDDFGTGYSSLANLRRLPIDDLKIDRSFVSPMLADESDLIIVRSTINLGHDLGLRIIAEGVEDAETLERLAVLGCDLAQGYHLSRPLDASSFGRWLADTPRTAPSAAVPVNLACAPAPAAGWTTAAGLVVASPEP